MGERKRPTLRLPLSTSWNSSSELAARPSDHTCSKKFTLSRSRPPRGVPGLPPRPAGLPLPVGVDIAPGHALFTCPPASLLSLLSAAGHEIHAAATHGPVAPSVSGFCSFHGRAPLVDTCSPHTTPYAHHHRRRVPSAAARSARLPGLWPLAGRTPAKWVENQKTKKNRVVRDCAGSVGVCVCTVASSPPRLLRFCLASNPRTTYKPEAAVHLERVT